MLGHVRVRHPENPERFFLACKRSPELIVYDDLIEYDLDCKPVVALNGRSQYSEVPIHGAIYAARPEVDSVVHSHAHDVIPSSNPCRYGRSLRLLPVNLLTLRDLC